MTEKDIQFIFNDSGVTWWLDSGSLLGLVRDGRFLKQDHDIDIGIIYDEADIINDLLSQFYSLGFRIVRFYFHGNMFKVKCVPRSSDVFKYILDIQLYNHYGSNYVCPQMVFKDNLSIYNRIRRELIRIKKANKADYVGNTIPIRVKRIISTIISKDDVSLEYNNRHSGLYDYYYWFIPDTYTKRIREINGYRVFEDTDAYLTHRYGEWRKPVHNWVFTRDDHALKKSNYSELLSFFDNGK